MKKKFLSLALAAVSVFCTGCGTASPQSSYNGYSSNYSYSNYIESSSSSSDYYDNNNDYNDQSYYDDDSDYDDDSWNYDDDDGSWDYDDGDGNYDDIGELTYGDFVALYSNEIIEDTQYVTYEDLARSTTGMADEYVKFNGEIIQVLEGNDAGYECYEILMNITCYNDGYYTYYDDTVVVDVIKDFLDVRPLEGDIVSIWGISTGFTSYETVLGDIRTEPCIVAARVDFTE